MKKIYLYISILLGLSLQACDMDKYPYDSADSKNYFKSFDDYEAVRNGFYSSLRSSTTGSFRLATEIQGFAFNAKDGFDNTYGEDYMWDFQTNHGSSIFAGYYYQIKNANFMLTEGIEKFKTTKNQYDLNEQQKINSFFGEAYFLRAFSYFQLTQLFCQGYSADIADKPATGMPLTLEYRPSAVAKTWSGRSTLNETYEQIFKDLDKADSLITLEGKIGNNYISRDAVTALRARAYLNKKDYDNAKKYAELIADKLTYKFTQGPNLRNMWYDDAGTESIWQIAMPSIKELGSPDGALFNGTTRFEEMNYMPSQDLINLYSPQDYRMNVYFERKYLKVNSGSSGNIYAFVKFNEDGKVFKHLKVSDAKYVHETQVFRLTEMYLIAAEAEALSTQPNLERASGYLNDVMEVRIEGFHGKKYKSADELMVELKKERKREFVGEGLYLSDQKRWGEGVVRTSAQNPNLVFIPNSTKTILLNKTADDYRMTWPIPKSEMDVNPQLKNQQNPNY